VLRTRSHAARHSGASPERDPSALDLAGWVGLSGLEPLTSALSESIASDTWFRTRPDRGCRSQRFCSPRRRTVPPAPFLLPFREPPWLRLLCHGPPQMAVARPELLGTHLEIPRATGRSCSWIGERSLPAVPIDPGTTGRCAWDIERRTLDTSRAKSAPAPGKAQSWSRS